MDPNSGELFNLGTGKNAEKLAKAFGLIPVKRELTAKEKMEMQIQLYQPCACGSGKKFKFCCKKVVKEAVLDAK